jgi:hypothetical protein
LSRHPLSRRAERALARSADAVAVAALLERRLRALGDVASGRSLHPRRRAALHPSPLMRRVLRRFEESWGDGEANAVRDLIGAWGDSPPAADPGVARRLLAAADALAAARAPEPVLICFLFELEMALGDPAGLP